MDKRKPHKVRLDIENNGKAGVYEILCTANNKRYIGSSNNLFTRVNRHFSLLNKNRHFNKYLQSAFNKYGESQFTVNVIEYTNYKYEAEQKYLDAYDFSLLFNLSSTAIGGGGNTIKSIHKIYQIALESAVVLEEFDTVVDACNAMNGNSRSIIEACNYPNLTRYGFRWVYAKDWNDIKHMYINGTAFGRVTEIYQISINSSQILNRFNSVKQACESVGVPSNKLFSINDAAHSCYNYRWCEASMYDGLKDELDKIDATTSRGRRMQVCQIDISTNTIIKQYDSLHSAFKETNVNISNISNCCSGKRKTAGGYKWESIHE